MRLSPPRQATTHTWRSILAAVPVVAAGLTEESWNSVQQEGKRRRVAWQGTSTGLFSVATAYAIQREETDLEVSNRWRQIWSFKGPQRGSYLLWQARLNSLPTNELLYRRQVRESSCCEHCPNTWETALHALRDCPQAKSLWNRCINGLSYRRFFDSRRSIADWIDFNLEPRTAALLDEDRWPYLFREILYLIWTQRNKQLFEDGYVRPDIDSLVRSAYDRVRNIRLAWGIDRSTDREDVERYR